MEPGRREHKKNQKIEAKSKTQFPYLPEEIVLRILSKLSIDSLLRFRCVSKPWLSSIHDLKFKQQQVIVLSKRVEKWIIKSLSIQLIDHRGSIKDLPVPKPFMQPTKLPEIMGSCNGILLVRVGLDCFLWNPLNRCCIKAISIERFRYNFNGYFIVSGLCYDSYTDDYKIVLWNSGHCFVMVGSCRNKTWTEIPFPYYGRKVRAGPTIGDRFHWLIRKIDVDEFSQPYSIVCFDPQSNEVVDVPMPHREGERKEDILLGLGVLDGCLSLVFCRGAMRPDASDVEVLAMKKIEDKTCWTSLFIIPNFSGLCPSDMLVPLYTVENGEVLILWDVRDQQGIVAYNPKYKTYRDFPMPNNFTSIDATVFVESLVSLPSHNCNE
ncbi:F-box protein CPR1-like [Actinidia eriantha]|uniref:F-box protein CPR1-like n=1 Tax=Actinidia eriantha TaxID=165200 RepID=UPI00258D8CE2|nr:F-box protein CPR1-like [Actinidia eriantha]